MLRRERGGGNGNGNGNGNGKGETWETADFKDIVMALPENFIIKVQLYYYSRIVYA